MLLRKEGTVPGFFLGCPQGHVFHLCLSPDCNLDVFSGGKQARIMTEAASQSYAGMKVWLTLVGHSSWLCQNVAIFTLMMVGHMLLVYLLLEALLHASGQSDAWQATRER
jgi:hypothetical protein